MFVQVAKDVENKIRSAGWLSLEPVTKGLNYDNCNVVYKKMINNVEVTLRRLFTCSICSTGLVMIVWEIKMFESNIFYLDEAEQYLFLQMLVESIEVWALKRKLMSVNIHSGLPHMSEILINNGFALSNPIEFVPGIKTYGGTKILENPTKREEI